jgi:hypothetical protein
VDILHPTDLHVLLESGTLENEEQLTTEISDLYWPCCVHDIVADQDLMLCQKMHVILNQNHVLVAYDEELHYFH